MPPKKDGGENVKVVVRCRPPNSAEIERSEPVIVKCNSKTGSIIVQKPDGGSDEMKQFTFDCVYGSEATQKQIFAETAAPILDSVLSGFNGTIFAYGQTGTGKTHTMEGVLDDVDLRGIMPNAFCYIFDRVNSATHNVKFLIRASFLEIYKDDVFDLLSTGLRQKVEVKESKEKGVFVKDLNVFEVSSVEDLMKVLKVGKKQRMVGATKMNAGSSRSHSILTITVETSETIVAPKGAAGTGGGGGGAGPGGGDSKENIHYRVGKMHLVDLAGSERQKKTEATGERLDEAKSINWSLTVLGNCIKALVEPNSKHVPFRDSKLTRLLQDSLGGNTKTMMIANLGPAASNHDETLSTLRYADRAKNIKNKPVVNEDPKDAKLRELQEELQRLRALMEARKAGGGGMSPSYGSEGSGMRGSGTRGEDYENIQTMDAFSDVEQIVELVPVEKIIYEDTGISEDHIKDMEAEHEATIAKFTEQAAVEKAKLAEQKMLWDQTKETVEAELNKKNALLSKEEQELQKLAETIEEKERQVLAGGEQLDKAAQQQLELKRTQAELKNRLEQQRKLKQELQEAEEAELLMTQQYADAEDELVQKTAKLKKLWSKYQEKKQDLEYLNEEFSVERADLVDTIRNLDRQLKLKQLLLDQFIPPQYSRMIEANAQYDSFSDEWRVRGTEVAGNNINREYEGGSGGGLNAIPGGMPMGMSMGMGGAGGGGLDAHPYSGYAGSGGASGSGSFSSGSSVRKKGRSKIEGGMSPSKQAVYFQYAKDKQGPPQQRR